MTPLDDPLLDDRDGPRDECGVFGVYAPGSDVARLSYFALYALQHRGQESAGIAVADSNGHITTLRDRGLVSQVFDEQKLRALPGQMAIGHVRYSTTGSSNWENSQPVHRSDKREVALAHNGNLINAVELRDERRADDRGGGRGGPAAARGCVLDRGLDTRLRRGVPRSARVAAAGAGSAGRPFLRRLRELRLRHARRQVHARSRAGRDGFARRARAGRAPGGAA